MKASDYIANFLSKHTEYAYGGQGSSVIHFIDSFKKNKKINFISGQSEQGSSLAADAYHRVSGKLGVTLGTSGPGIINFLQGMACSYFDSVPGLYIAGAPTINNLRKNKKIRQIGFQEMEVQDMVKPICKYCKIITKIDDLSYELEKAIFIANHGRKGPVLLEIPDDLSRMQMPKKLKKFKASEHFKSKSDLKINQVKKMLEKSKKPLFIIGNGVQSSKSLNDVKQLIKKFKIPYACTWATAHNFSTDDKLNAGVFGVAATRFGNFSLQTADLVIFLGTRLSSQIVGGDLSTFALKAKKILVEIDKEEFKNHRLPKIDLKVNCDVKFFLKELKKTKLKINHSIINLWIKKINFYKSNYKVISKKNITNKKHVDPYFFFDHMFDVVKKNSIIIPDASANLIWTYQCLKIKKKLNMFTAFNHSPMGYSMAAGIGAFFADKKNTVIAIIGDGSMPMNIQELETIKNYNCNIIILVINNKGYSLIKQTQETWLNSNYAGVDKKSGLSLPDNCKLAKAYGIKSVVIKNHIDVKKKLKKILNSKGPILVDIMIDPKARVKPKIEFGKSLHNMSPLLSKTEIQEILRN